MVAEHDNADMAKHLIARKANLNLRNDSGRTVLFLAPQNGKNEIVYALLSAGADPCIADDQGNTPLFRAAESGHWVTVTPLLADSRIDVNYRGLHGQTVLHLAARNGKNEILDALLSAGADPHIADDDGDTPSFIATEYGYEAIAKFLKEHEDLKNANVIPHLDEVVVGQNTVKKSRPSCCVVM